MHGVEMEKRRKAEIEWRRKGKDRRGVVWKRKGKDRMRNDMEK